MKLLSWNIRHGGGGNGSLAPALMAHEPDVIVLCEYRAAGSKKLIDQLRFFGWPHIAASRVAGETNGVAVVSREAINPAASPLGGAPLDLWAVEVELPVLSLNDFSYIHHKSGPPSKWRIDHAFVSPPLAASVRDCHYSHTERERNLSDHSMLIIELA